MNDQMANVFRQMVELCNEIEKLGPKYAIYMDKIADLADSMEAVK